MRRLLMVLAPRDLPEEHASIRALPVDQVWFRAHTEQELVPAIATVVEEAEEYDALLIVSDDVVVTPAAYHRVAALLECAKVATGYCRLTADDPRVNLTLAPGLPAHGSAGPWRKYADVRAHSEPVLRTWFAGWSLTGMWRERWRKYPFQCHVTEAAPTGTCSDRMLALRLQAAGARILAHRDAEIRHTRNRSGRRVGLDAPTVTRHPCADPYLPDPAEVEALREAVRREADAFRELRKRVPEGYLLSHVDGDSPRFGRLEAETMVTHDAEGHPLTPEAMREAAARSRYLTFVPWRR